MVSFAAYCHDRYWFATAFECETWWLPFSFFSCSMLFLSLCKLFKPLIIKTLLYGLRKGFWILLTPLNLKEECTEPDNSHISLSHLSVALSLPLMLHFLCLKIRESAVSSSYLQVFVSHLSWQMASALWAFTGFGWVEMRREEWFGGSCI